MEGSRSKLEGVRGIRFATAGKNPDRFLKQTLSHMVAMKELASRNPKVREAAFSILGPGNQHESFDTAAKLAEWIQYYISYQRDPIGQETLAEPLITLKIGYGDCDDQAILLSSLLESIGIETRFRIVGNKVFQHVLTEARVKRYNINVMEWLPFETIYQGFPPGVMPPAVKSAYVKVI